MVEWVAETTGKIIIKSVKRKIGRVSESVRERSKA